MDDLYLDLESYSAVPLRSHGAHRYAEKAEVMLVGLAWDDGPASVIDLTDPATRPRRLAELQRMIDHAQTIVTHGSFDRILLGAMPGPKVIVPVEKQDDTLLVALQHSMPGGLGALCTILGVPTDEAKNKEGGKLVNLFCSPTPSNWKLRRATKETHPTEWQRFVDYCRLDVVAMRHIRKRLPRWNCTPLERQFWYHDQACNERGMAVDLDHAAAAIIAYDRVKHEAKDEAHRMTGGGLASVGQRDAMLNLLRKEYGWEGDLTKANLERILRGDIPDKLRQLLALRLKASAASPAKYTALRRATCQDGRLRDTLQFCGAARTGRDAGRIFQPQNLPRPSLPKAAVDVGIEALQAGCADLLFDVSELVVSAVRGTITAAPGHKLLVADLSNIEGRVLAWLAEEQWKLDAFRAYDDGTGEEIYRLTAGGILGKAPGDVTKLERDRMGKVPELACGYQGALGAFRRMGGVKVEAMRDDEIVTIVKGWRKRHPKTQRFWYAMEDAARAAVGDPAKRFPCGRISYDMADGPDGIPYLRMRLPGGRYLCYQRPTTGITKCDACAGEGVIRPHAEARYETCDVCSGAGSEGDGKLGYLGINQTTHQWGGQTTYGGKLTENATQAVARDIFFHGVHLAEAMGYPLVLRVHDELVAEVPLDSPLTLEGLIACMVQRPVWAPDLPLAAAGFETARYFKD